MSDASDHPQSAEKDLTGKVCPYAVVEVIRAVDRMRPGETLTFTVNDALALKSVPEELAEYDDITCAIERREKLWCITVRRAA